MEQTFILNFLTQYKLWILAGVPKQNRYGFSAMDGLCINLENYCYLIFNPLFPKSEVYEIVEDARGFLSDMFRKDGLCDTYPFGGALQFMNDVDDKAHHLHADRLEWIRLKLELPYNQSATEA